MPKSILKKLVLLNKITLDSLDKESKVDIIKIFAETAIKILGGNFGFVWYKFINSHKYGLLYSSPSLRYNPNYPRKKGVNYKVQRSKSPLFITDISKAKFVSIDTKIYMKSLAVIPMVYKKNTYGNIVVGYKKAHFFSKEDQTLAGVLGNAVGQVITIYRLYHSLKDFKDTLDKTLDSIFIFDPETLKIAYANDGASEQFGLARRELYKRTMVEIQETYNHEEFQKLLAPLLRKEKKFLTAEGTIKNNRGRGVPVEMFLQFIHTPGQPSKILSIIQNISERKRVERESRHLLKQKDEFLSIASHELKTPLATIKGFAQLLETNLPEKNNKQKYFLEKINQGANILTRLVNDLLDISRIEVSKLKFRSKNFELSHLIESLSANLQMANTRHRILLRLKGQFWIFGDADRIGQVFINLVTNAIRYSPRARRVIVSLKEENGLAKVSVEDFGIGVDKKKRKKIFERFFQGRRTAETYPGLGLGLYISSKIIKAHRGKIICQGKKTKGSIFSFILPYKKCLPKKRKN